MTLVHERINNVKSSQMISLKLVTIDVINFKPKMAVTLTPIVIDVFLIIRPPPEFLPVFRPWKRWHATYT